VKVALFDTYKTDTPIELGWVSGSLVLDFSAITQTSHRHTQVHVSLRELLSDLRPNQKSRYCYSLVEAAMPEAERGLNPGRGLVVGDITIEVSVHDQQ
jgi:hypothetical protein